MSLTHGLQLILYKSIENLNELIVNLLKIDLNKYEFTHRMQKWDITCL